MSDAPGPAPVAARERVFTWPLSLFLAGVAVALGYGFYHKYPRPDLEGAIWLLADGDLDGDERIRMLRRTLALAEGDDGVAHRWAGLLAAVALDDRAAFARFRDRLGPGGSAPPLPPPAEREPLGLGDPALASVFTAMAAEAQGDRAEAGKRWLQVAAQARLTNHPFTAQLAAEALQRLK